MDTLSIFNLYAHLKTIFCRFTTITFLNIFSDMLIYISEISHIEYICDIVLG